MTKMWYELWNDYEMIIVYHGYLENTLRISAIYFALNAQQCCWCVLSL